MEKFDNLDIKKFYTNRKLEEWKHEERLLKNTIDNSESSRFWQEDKEQGIKLQDLIVNKDKIVILGNPGIGKTKELDNLFENLWNRKEKTELIPFFLNIKNFRSNDSFQELIKYKGWENLEKVCFIIDGLDEISNIQDFISTLELFLERNDDKTIKIVISCRTNIYEKYLVKIEDSEYFYLESLTDKQIGNILKNNFDIDISYYELNKYRIFLENPFNLNLFGKFYKENLRFPTNIIEAFELSITQELTLLNKEKFVKSELIDEVHVEHILKEIAIINELMHQDFIEEVNLYYLLGKDDKLLVEKISFIEKNPDSKSFIFRHKNYQEFLSAKYISNLKADEILKFIKIDGVNKTIPLLLNTISFLINILEHDEFNFIKEWLLEYEPEVLFFVEKEKLENKTQKEIFRKYFNDVTIEKTFLFGRDRRFSMEKIAQFADVDYLIWVIRNNDGQRRVVKSAFDILSYCKLNSDDLEKIKDILNLYIFSVNDYLVDALHTFGSLNLHREDTTLFLKICEYLENNMSKHVHSQILFMFKDFDNIDDYFKTFKTSLKIECMKTCFDRTSNVTWFLEGIILRTRDFKNFLEYYKILFYENSNLKLENFYNHEFEKKFKKKTLDFVNQNPEFIVNIFDVVFNSNKFSINNEYILNLIIDCNQKNVLFRHIVEQYGITSYTNSPLSLVFEESLIYYFIQKLNENSIIFQDDYNYEYFRNRVAYNNFSLAIKFENILIENGYSFKEKLLTPEKREEIDNINKIFSQNYFDVLFNDEKIIFEINKLFNEYNIDQINFEILSKISVEHYKNIGFHSIQNSILSLIQKILEKYEFLDKQEIKERALDVYARLCIIRNKLDSLDSGIEFEINQKHIDWINKECINFSTIIDFKEIDLSGENTEDFNKFNTLKLILYFDYKFNINYSKEFYFRVLDHCNLSNLMNNCFDFIKDRIGNLKSFNEQIISNINNNLDYRTLKIHIEYAINNKLSQVYSKIKEIILNKFEYIFSDKLIPNFVLVLSGQEKIEFLKSCIKTDVKYLQWEAVNILQSENLEKEFLINFAKSYLNDEDNIEYNSSALDILVKFNYGNFLKYFHKSILQVEEYQLFNSEDICNTEKVIYQIDKNELSLLKPIFYIIFRSEVKDSFEFQNARGLFKSFIINQSKSQNGFEKIKSILIDIKTSLFEKKTLFFYINLLIDECELSYCDSLSKCYSFDEAKTLIEHIKKPIQERMGNTFNFGPNSIFNGNQFGEGNSQTNYFNSYSTNSDLLKAEEILKEFQQLKVENDEWKDIFVEGMKDLLELKQADTEEKAEETKTTLRKWYDRVFDMGKRLNDWKNITFLGVEFADKTPRLLDLIKHVSKLFLQ